MAGLARVRRIRKSRSLQIFQVAPTEQRQIEFRGFFFPLSELVSKTSVRLPIPDQREVILKEIPETHLVNPIFFPAEDPLEGRRQWRIEIHAWRDFPIDRYIEVPKWVLFAYRNIDGA